MSGIEDVYVVSARRTAVAKIRGALKYVRPDDLLAHILRDVIEQVPSFPLEEIGDVIVGCAMPEAEQGMNVARISTLLSGLPDTIPAMTINRFCASGLESIAIAAQRIASGQISAAIAGGIESMSWIPLGGLNYRPNSQIFDSDSIGISYGMGLTAEIVASQFHISRASQEQFALESHQKALLAQQKGEFDSEISPYSVHWNKPDHKNCLIQRKSNVFEVDEGPRVTSLEALSRLKPVFKADGSVTAGTCSQMSDGAAALLLVNHSLVQKLGLKPLARLKSYAVTGVAPEIMGVGPIAAIPKALEKAHLKLEQIQWIELNEAFAAQSLAVIQELGLNRSRVNPLGGAIALGHPLGATGAIRAVTLIHAMRRRSFQYGMVTMCIGTGMGACGIFERCP